MYMLDNAPLISSFPRVAAEGVLVQVTRGPFGF